MLFLTKLTMRTKKMAIGSNVGFAIFSSIILFTKRLFFLRWVCISHMCHDLYQILPNRKIISPVWNANCIDVFLPKRLCIPVNYKLYLFGQLIDIIFETLWPTSKERSLCWAVVANVYSIIFVWILSTLKKIKYLIFRNIESTTS